MNVLGSNYINFESFKRYATDTFVSVKRRTIYFVGECAQSLNDIYSLSGLEKLTNVIQRVIKFKQEYSKYTLGVELHTYDKYMMALDGHKAILLFIRPLKVCTDFIQCSEDGNYSIGFNKKWDWLECASKVITGTASFFKDYAYWMKYNLPTIPLSTWAFSLIGQERAENSPLVKKALNEPEEVCAALITVSSTIELIQMGRKQFAWKDLTSKNLTNREWWYSRFSWEDSCKVASATGKIASINFKEALKTAHPLAPAFTEVLTYGAGFVGMLLKERRTRAENLQRIQNKSASE